MKIGIMGGTFDPVHNGHMMIAEAAYRQFELDEIWFMPNGNPPHKLLRSIGSDVRHRVRMVQLAISEYPYFRLEAWEADRQEVSCSYKTMESLKQLHPEDEFYFIIGADSLFSIEKWVHPEKLFKTCTILAAYRGEKDTAEEKQNVRDQKKTAAKEERDAGDGQESAARKERDAGDGQEAAITEEMKAKMEHLRKKYGVRIGFIQSRPFYVSSSELRERIRNGKDIHGLVPEKVEEYITEEGLYES